MDSPSLQKPRPLSASELLGLPFRLPEERVQPEEKAASPREEVDVTPTESPALPSKLPDEADEANEQANLPEEIERGCSRGMSRVPMETWTALDSQIDSLSAAMRERVPLDSTLRGLLLDHKYTIQITLKHDIKDLLFEESYYRERKACAETKIKRLSKEVMERAAKEAKLQAEIDRLGAVLEERKAGFDMFTVQNNAQWNAQREMIVNLTKEARDVRTSYLEREYALRKERDDLKEKNHKLTAHRDEFLEERELMGPGGPQNHGQEQVGQEGGVEAHFKRYIELKKKCGALEKQNHNLVTERNELREENQRLTQEITKKSDGSVPEKSEPTCDAALMETKKSLTLMICMAIMEQGARSTFENDVAQSVMFYLHDQLWSLSKLIEEGTGDMGKDRVHSCLRILGDGIAAARRAAIKSEMRSKKRMMEEDDWELDGTEPGEDLGKAKGVNVVKGVKEVKEDETTDDPDEFAIYDEVEGVVEEDEGVNEAEGAGGVENTKDVDKIEEVQEEEAISKAVEIVARETKEEGVQELQGVVGVEASGKVEEAGMERSHFQRWVARD